MKYIKTFEVLTEQPKVGDYVVIDVAYPDEDFIKFLNSNIGRIYKIPHNTEKDPVYIVKYDNVPNKFDNSSKEFSRDYNHAFSNGCWDVYDNDIVAISNNKEDLAHLVAANKYNL